MQSIFSNVLMVYMCLSLLKLVYKPPAIVHVFQLLVSRHINAEWPLNGSILQDPANSLKLTPRFRPTRKIPRPLLTSLNPPIFPQNNTPKTLNIAMHIKDRTFVITGGASGLGLATAEDLHRHGGYIAILDMNPENGAKIVSQLGKER